MVEPEFEVTHLILVLGGIILLTILVGSGLKRIGVPSLIGFMILGFLLRVADSHWTFLSEEAIGIFDFLATVGIIFLLFRVGLESNLPGLKRQLKPASVIWLGNILFSGILGYVMSYFVLGLDLIPSLFVAIALTATSVAISVAVWQEAKAIKSPTGELLVDVAEMDDISAMVLMALLFATAPMLREGLDSTVVGVLFETLGWLSFKLVGFGVFCALFSRYLEHPITHFFSRIGETPAKLLMIAGLGLIIAGLAELLGLSVAIGAFFAGLIFSRDPETVKLDTPFGTLYGFFTPFFFIGIGLNIDPGTLTMGLGIGGALLVVAIIGKLVGAGGPAMLTTECPGSLLLSISMVPRAEIALVI
ncbi:MAG: cation:proton antiporter, partial [Dehalococcoidia bacterium]|nr:cation:proton antiporter [Dehalococcoidia bacterium]